MVGRRRLEASFPCPHSTATSTGRTARSPSGRRSLEWLRTVSRPRRGASARTAPPPRPTRRPGPGIQTRGKL